MPEGKEILPTPEHFRHARETYKPYREQAVRHLETIDHPTSDRNAVRRTAKEFYKRDQKSETDFDTGVPNQRGFALAFEREYDRAKRTGEPMAVIVADLNHLKKINDSEGHDAGTAYIRKAASILSLGNRPTDIVARHGGDEFYIALPGANTEGATIWAQRKIPFLQDAGVSISMGIAEVKVGDPRKLEEIKKEAIGQADEAMFKAKAGSNHTGCAVEVYREPVLVPTT